MRVRDRIQTKLEAAFAHFDETPIASASLAPWAISVAEIIAFEGIQP